MNTAAGSARKVRFSEGKEVTYPQGGAEVSGEDERGQRILKQAFHVAEHGWAASLPQAGIAPEASVLGARSCHQHRPHASWQTRLPTACPKATFPRAGGPLSLPCAPSAHVPSPSTQPGSTAFPTHEV